MQNVNLPAQRSKRKPDNNVAYALTFIQKSGIKIIIGLAVEGTILKQKIDTNAFSDPQFAINMGQF